MHRSLFIASTIISSTILFRQQFDKSVVQPHSNNTGTWLRDSVFVLKGRISGQHKGFIKLYYTNKNGTFIRDSITIVNNSFQFTGNITDPTRAYLEGSVATGGNDSPNGVNFFLEPAVITIELTFNKFKNAVIKGSKTEDEYQVLARSIAPVQKEMEPISKEFDEAAIPYRAVVKAKKSDAEIDSLRNNLEKIREKYIPYNNRVAQLHYDFFFKHPQSYVTVLYLRSYVSRLTLDSLKFFYDRLGPLQQTNSGKQIAKEIEQMQSGMPGSMAKSFSSKEIGGALLSLSDYKGKYVLLDFWASWCIPCRKGNPHLKDLYAKYKEKGIEFIGIADDDEEEDKWKAAVTKDGIGIWKHIRRGLKYVNGKADKSNDINDKFGVQTLPTKILIDKEGKIVGRYDENEEQLDEMLKKIFGY